MPWTNEKLEKWLKNLSPIGQVSPTDQFGMAERNDATFSRAMTLWQNVQGATVDSIVKLLLKHLNPKCTPQWDESELREVVELASDPAYLEGEISESTMQYFRDNGWLVEIDPTAVVGNSNVVNLADIEREDIQWLWPKRIAAGKMTMVAGDPGLGKSFVTLDMAARVSRGIDWPDHTANVCGPVVLLSAEDGLADTIKPRLEAAGADCSNIIALKSVHQAGFNDRHFSLQTDIKALEDAIRWKKGCKLVIIDPITAYCGDSDSHKNAEIRALLSPLSDLAERTGVAIVCVSHLNKGQGAAIYRTMGSLAFVAAARAAFIVAKDQSDPSRRLFLPVKNNIGDDVTGLAYRITDGRVAWEPELVNVTSDEALTVPEHGKGSKVNDKLETAIEAVTEWFTADPPVKEILATDIEEWAKGRGITDHMLKKAKKELGIKSERKGFGPDSQYMWVAPDSMFPTPNTAHRHDLHALHGAEQTELSL